MRNYKTLISSHDELPGHINCDSPKLEENSLERLPTTPEYNNHLYGSTPDSREYFSKSFEKRLHSRLPERNLLRTDPHSVNQLESHGFNYDSGRGQIEDDYVGPAMELVSFTKNPRK